MVRFDASEQDAVLIGQIVDRALPKMGGVKRDLLMDVTAVHLNDRPLRLADLLAAPDFDFFHDLVGIRRHVNRSTGKLGGCFVPRFTGAK